MLNVDITPTVIADARPAESGTPANEAVITAAVLCATAFRLRDEAFLIDALRQLVSAVNSIEQN